MSMAMLMIMIIMMMTSNVIERKRSTNEEAFTGKTKKWPVAIFGAVCL
jgi:hypothetical protein